MLFISGLLAIGLYIFINTVDPSAGKETLIFLVMGILMCLIIIPSFLFNFGAFFRIHEDSIKARYHLFGKIDCKLSDVTFSLAQINTLTIQLKDGKIHTIMGIRNSWELASVILRNMSFEITEQPETLMEQLNKMKNAKRKGLMYVCLGIALMFVTIFITVFLTGAKEMHEFNKTDWIIFISMCTIETVTTVVTFFFAYKTGKNNIPIDKLQYTVQRRVIETKPLPSGNVVKVFADENYSERVTVLNCPGDDSVYYIVQQFDSEYKLIRAYRSDIFESIDMLSEGLQSLIDITKRFLN